MTSVNLSITDLTWKKLGEWGKIALPGVGTFSLESTPAQLDLIRNTIVSSEGKISYNQHIPLDSRFNIYEVNVSRDWMQVQYPLFLNLYNNSINESGSFHFKHIGTLKQTPHGIQFFADPDSILIQRGKELQQIAFTPVERSYVKPEADAPQVHNRKPGKKYSFSRLTWLALFVVINSALIFWLVEKKRSNAEMDSLSVSLPDNRLNVKPSADAPLPDVPEIRKDSLTKIDTSVAEIPVETIDSPMVKTPPSADNKEIPFFKTPAGPSKPLIPDSQPDIAVPSEKQEIKVEQEVKHEGKCAIIVGSFKEKANVEKMQQRIVKAGFEAYTQQGKRLTKVGIITGCEEVATVLEFAQSNFHPDAWVHPIQ